MASEFEVEIIGLSPVCQGGQLSNFAKDPLFSWTGYCVETHIKTAKILPFRVFCLKHGPYNGNSIQLDWQFAIASWFDYFTFLFWAADNHSCEYMLLFYISEYILSLSSFLSPNIVLGLWSVAIAYPIIISNLTRMSYVLCLFLENALWSLSSSTDMGEHETMRGI